MDSLEQQVIETVRKDLRVHALPRDYQFNCTLDRVAVCMTVEDTLNITMTDAEIMKVNTVEDLITVTKLKLKLKLKLSKGTKQ